MNDIVIVERRHREKAIEVLGYYPSSACKDWIVDGLSVMTDKYELPGRIAYWLAKTETDNYERGYDQGHLDGVSPKDAEIESLESRVEILSAHAKLAESRVQELSQTIQKERAHSFRLAQRAQAALRMVDPGNVELVQTLLGLRD